MKKKLFYPKSLISTCCLTGMLLLAGASSAQNPRSIEVSPKPGQADYKKNNIKINLSSLVLNNYSLYYERSLSRKISFTVGYRSMSNSTIGKMPLFKNTAERFLDEDLFNDLDQISASNNAFTGKFRFYGGKHPGARGFYLSLYGRYTDLKVNYDYEYQTDNKTYNIPLKNNISGFGVTLDMYILGGHYGKLEGDGNAQVDLSSMTTQEKQQLKKGQPLI